MLAWKFSFLLGSFYRIYGDHNFCLKSNVRNGDSKHSIYSFEDLPFVEDSWCKGFDVQVPAQNPEFYQYKKLYMFHFKKSI